MPSARSSVLVLGLSDFSVFLTAYQPLSSTPVQLDYGDNLNFLTLFSMFFSLALNVTWFPISLASYLNLIIWSQLANPSSFFSFLLDPAGAPTS